MVDIVQLQENGEPKYLATHVKAVEGLESEIAKAKGGASINYDRSCRFIAHRGNHTDYPENSIPAFLNVNSHWGIETDVQVTKDGAWITMHDPTVDRTTSGKGNIKDMTLAQIKALTLNSKFPGKLATGYDKVPTFEEYLQCCKNTQKVPIIEIKDNTYTATNYDKLAQTLKDYGMEQSAVIISFGYNQLTQMRTRLPQIPLHYLVEEISDTLITQAQKLNGQAVISVNYSAASVTEANVKKCHNAGLMVGVWTVPDSARDKMITLGVDLITTDEPGGELRVSKPTLETGFTFNEGDKLVNSSVREIGNGLIALNLSISGGANTKGTSICKLPDWAIPTRTVWADAKVRTSSGVAFCSVDIGSWLDLNPGKVLTGIGWEARTTWATISIVYPKS